MSFVSIHFKYSCSLMSLFQGHVACQNFNLIRPFHGAKQYGLFLVPHIVYIDSSLSLFTWFSWVTLKSSRCRFVLFKLFGSWPFLLSTLPRVLMTNDIFSSSIRLSRSIVASLSSSTWKGNKSVKSSLYCKNWSQHIGNLKKNWRSPSVKKWRLRYSAESQNASNVKLILGFHGLVNHEFARTGTRQSI